MKFKLRLWTLLVCFWKWNERMLLTQQLWESLLSWFVLHIKQSLIWPCIVWLALQVSFLCFLNLQRSSVKCVFRLECWQVQVVVQSWFAQKTLVRNEVYASGSIWWNNYWIVQKAGWRQFKGSSWWFASNFLDLSRKQKSIIVVQSYWLVEHSFLC